MECKQQSITHGTIRNTDATFDENIGPVAKCNHCSLLTNFSSIRLVNYSEMLTSGQLPVLLYVISWNGMTKQ
jgi:hypothetical protein